MKVKNIHLVIFCVLFTVTQLWFGIGGIGLEVKGSWILMAPFSWYFINWLLLMFAIFWARRATEVPSAVLFLLIMLLHYALTFSEVVGEFNRFRVSPTDQEGLGRVLARYPEQLVFGALTYVVGNLVVWVLFLKRDSLR